MREACGLHQIVDRNAVETTLANASRLWRQPFSDFLGLILILRTINLRTATFTTMIYIIIKD